ncbi:MAG: TonB-dependent receptor family protein [Segatella maculosa]
MNLHQTIFAIVCFISPLSTAHAQQRSHLNDTVILLKEVSVRAGYSLTSPNIMQALANQRRIAGSTSLVEIHADHQRMATMKEALRLQPGVIIQEFFGANDQPRLNIRGSGIQSNPQRRGVYLLQDGIPVNFSDGSYVIGIMDAMTARYIEVFKGANALRFGAGTLGGALNFVSRTALTDSTASVKLEGGSYGTFGLTFSMGKRLGAWDMFAASTYNRQDGYRIYNKNQRLTASVNIGWRNRKQTVENRTFVHFTHLFFQMPGPLTLDQLMTDPKQVSTGVDLPFSMGPNILRDRPHRNVDMFRIANQTGFVLNAKSNLSASVYYQYADDWFAFPITISIPHSFNNDIGATLYYHLSMSKMRFSAGVLGAFGWMDRRYHINKDGKASFMFARDRLHAANFTVFTEADYALHDQLHAVLDVHGVYNKRNSKDAFGDPSLRPWYSHMSKKYRYFYSQNSTLRQHFTAFNPRIGLIWNPVRRKDIQLFANVSNSYEPPTFDELVGTEVTSNINTSPKKLFSIALKKQTATTFELGSRGRLSRLSWNVAFYHSWVANEILEIKDYVRGQKRTENYPNTVHQGLEVGIQMASKPRLFGYNIGSFTIGAVYDYSRFTFKGGKYDGKYLAGVPKHYINTSLDYQHTCGLNGSISLELKPGETPIDHTNTMFQPAYHVWNARLGYQIGTQWNLYVELKNIANRRYASSYIISDEIHQPAIPFPEFTAKQLTFFIPGQPRSMFAGLTWRW